MLKDLNQVIQECRATYDALPDKNDVRIDPFLAKLLKKELSEIERKSLFEVSPYSITITTESKLKTDLPSSLLWYAYAFYPLESELTKYQSITNELKAYLKGIPSYTSKDIDSYLKKLPSEHEDFTSPIGIQALKYLKENLDNDDLQLFLKLLTDRDWWFQPLKISEQTKGKTLERTDVFQSSFCLAARVIVANSARLQTIVKTFSNSPELVKYFSSMNHDVTYFSDNVDKSMDTVNETITLENSYSSIKGNNIIFYGAPGTGKSHIINEKTASSKKVITVFHPDTQYSDFVGSLKPKMEEDPNDSSKRQITYQFRPGSFTKALVQALNSPNEHMYLIIEEINRAPAAAVFGELFQLLDREHGASKYEIDATDPDMLDYINSQLSADKCITKLFIPANLSLLATMNSSDQAVMPMDTAFKRRWSFKYIKIDFNNVDVPKNTFLISTTNGVYNISWSSFAQIINKTLIECSVAEDRLLGPFFLNQNEMEDEEATKDTLSGKLFVYLWDDVLRHLGHTKLFAPNYKTFGDLSNAFQTDLPIFNSQIEEAIKDNGEEVISAGSKKENISE
ncbi:AAA family ATPase [uncultured Psychromonas sp.]|uniref:McrB family protein n=1 Tax=uncultured Psychromonas sp. TaxID=173974 RepID=UPI00262E83D1|nr:AAA family ATPase [uncultured Psychromonas sp.]